MATSDLLPEAPVGCGDVIVFVVESSICIASIYSVALLCAHKLLSLLRGALFTVAAVPVHSFVARTEPSIHGAGRDRIVLECEDEKKRNRERNRESH